MVNFWFKVSVIENILISKHTVEETAISSFFGSSIGFPSKSNLLLWMLWSICRCCSPEESIASKTKSENFFKWEDVDVKYLECNI